VIGLACGWRAAQRGLRVCVLERGQPGCGATYAAAGVLAPETDVEPGREAFVPFAHRSADLYPGFAAELAEISGLDIAYERSGTLYVALDRDELEAIRREHELHRRLGLSTEWLSAGACRVLAPGLAPQCAGGLHAPHEAQVDPRILAAALAAALRSAGGELRAGAHVVDGVRDGGRLCGVVTADGARVLAARVLLAAGAWSASCALGQEPVPVRPVKGQVLRLRGPGDARPAECMVRTERVYVVPRRSGEVVVGASVEEHGFDTTVTAGGVYELLREAYRALPDIAELELVEAFAGLRPGSPDNGPLLGEWGDEGLFVATGHHRNGILLAPVTAEAIAALLLDEEPAAEAVPFAAARFGTAVRA